MGRLTVRVAAVKATTRSAASALSGFDLRGTRLVTNQAVEPVLQKAILPASNAGLGLGRSPHDLVRADSIGGQQHDFSPPDVLLRRVAVLHHSFEPANIGGRNGEGIFLRASRRLARRARIGNPSQDSNVRFDPLAEPLTVLFGSGRTACEREGLRPP